MEDSVSRGFRSEGLVGYLLRDGKYWDDQGNAVTCAACGLVVNVLPGEKILARPTVDPTTGRARDRFFHDACAPLGVD